MSSDTSIDELDNNSVTDAEEPTEDIMEFMMRFGKGQSDVGNDTKGARVLEVAQVWDNALLDARHYAKGGKSVSIGASTGWRWSLLGVDLAWVSTPMANILPLFPPMWSEVNSDWRCDFYAPDGDLPSGVDHVLIENSTGGFKARLSTDWAGTADINGKTMALADLVAAGLATLSGDTISVPMIDDLRLFIKVGTLTFLVHTVLPGKKIISKMTDDVDYPFVTILTAMSFFGLMFGILMFTAPKPATNEMFEIPDRFVELLIERPEPEPPKDKPKANPDAGEGAKAKKEEGKVGKKDAKMEKAKGNKVEIRKKEMDRQIAENAGVLGALREGAELDGVFGNSGLNADIAGGIGGLIGAKGTQIGSGGLGSRGSGLGGGGTAEGLGGLGTKGRGAGSSGFGKGGGNFGAKGEGRITAVGGDPIIMGALDKALIDEVVKRHMNQIKYCYQRELTKNPKLGGKVKIKFVISKNGSVARASVGSTSMKNKAVESCISSRFLRMQFPKPKGGGIVIVQYPFVFGT